MSKDSKLVDGERTILGFTFDFGACCMRRGKEHTIIEEWLDGMCPPELASPASQAPGVTAGRAVCYHRSVEHGKVGRHFRFQ